MPFFNRIRLENSRIENLISRNFHRKVCPASYLSGRQVNTLRQRMERIEIKSINLESPLEMKIPSQPKNTRSLVSSMFRNLGLHPKAPVVTLDGKLTASELRPGMPVLTGSDGFAPLKSVLTVSFNDSEDLRMVRIPNSALRNTNPLICGEDQELVVGGHLGEERTVSGVPKYLSAGVFARLLGLEFIENDQLRTVLLDVGGSTNFYAGGIAVRSNTAEISAAWKLINCRFQRCGHSNPT